MIVHVLMMLEGRHILGGLLDHFNYKIFRAQKLFNPHQNLWGFKFIKMKLKEFLLLIQIMIKSSQTELKKDLPSI